MKVRDSIYKNSTWWIQNILINLWAFTSYNKPKFKRGYSIQKRVLTKNETYSRDELITYSFNRFKELLKYCYENVPYYKNKWMILGINPEHDIKTPDDITIIPLLTKDEVRENYVHLISTIADKHFPIYSHTSGTTGTPLHFAISLETRLNYLAVLDRYRRWFGYRPDLWTASIGGKEIIGYAKNGPRWRYCLPYQTMSGLSKMILYDSLYINTDSVQSYVTHMKKKDVRYIKGYPSNLYEFTKILDELNEELPLDVVFTGSEPLHDFIEELLLRKFKVKTIADFYGNSECVAFSHRHPQYDDYFIPIDSVWVEIIDPTTGSPTANPGEVIGTNLFNLVMPLIRYRTGDTSQFVVNNSHLPFPSMKRVYTKYEDSVFTIDNSIISPSSLTHPFKEVSPRVFKNTQIRQKKAGYLTICYVPGDKFNSQSLDTIKSNFKERFKDRFTLEFEEMEYIAREKSGKYRWVVNEIRSYHT
jgi:phenylacetate-CoA ligase